MIYKIDDRVDDDGMYKRECAGDGCDEQGW